MIGMEHKRGIESQWILSSKRAALCYTSKSFRDGHKKFIQLIHILLYKRKPRFVCPPYIRIQPEWGRDRRAKVSVHCAAGIKFR